MKLRIWLSLYMVLILQGSFAGAAPKPGFVVHFDFVSNVREARDLVRIAAGSGAEVINVVPPAHVWENPLSVQMLDAILREISNRHLSFVFTRIDGSHPPDKSGERFNYLYGNILTEPGILPNGKETGDYFRTTIGRKGYLEWMEEETRYYAEHYGRLQNLLGINLGPFSEPFSAERCGFLMYEADTQRYEITQYTPEAAAWFRGWLAKHYRDIQGVNAEYATAFESLDQFPLPLNEKDSRFGKPAYAYFDFARSLNDWLVEAYERCRQIWHEKSGRPDVPFILQHCGAFTEKLAKGRPGFAAFEVADWIYRADATGLSLYTNSGFPDFGHASVRAAVNVAALARELGKPVFVLEGGTEAPNVILDPGELKFYGSVARSLNPVTYIYEFLKEKFDEPYKSNPGKIVNAAGRIQKPAQRALRELFREISADRTSPRAAELYFIPDSLAARENSYSGELNAAICDLATDLSIRLVPRGAVQIIQPGVPVVQSNGEVNPPNQELSDLLRHIPGIGSAARPNWNRAVIRAARNSRKEPG
jgi:hypothetical protein